MNRNVIETVLGAVVLVVAAIFVFFALNTANSGTKSGYVVTADFDRIDGLKSGSDVRMNGVDVGSVLDVVLNKDTYRAAVRFSLDPAIKLPRDTVAMIASESLLGGKYLSLEIGVDDEMIAADGSGRLTHTTPPMRLDDLIGQLIYKEDKKTSGANAAPMEAQPPSAAPVLDEPPVVPMPDKKSDNGQGTWWN